MKISYDPKVDAAYIRLKEGKFQVTTHRLTEEIAITDVSIFNGYRLSVGCNVSIISRNVSNYGPDGAVVGIEILDASKYLFKHKRPEVQLENLQPA